MSLILEALRKSEAERQRGRAPGLFVEQVTTRPPQRAKMPAWAWLLGGLLLATLAVLGWQLQRDRAPNPVSDPTQVANREPGPVPSAVASPAPAASVEAVAVTADTMAPAATSDAALPKTPSAMAPPNTTAPLATTAPAPASVPDSLPTTASSLDNRPLAAPVPEPTPTTAPSDRNRGPDPSPPPAESLPTLATLDAATRAQLPPLKLSMHVFADAPAQRFVILDGQRLGEGASPVAGIVLEEIRREGLVISVNGQRLLLARP